MSIPSSCISLFLHYSSLSHHTSRLIALLWPVTTSQPLSVCADLCYLHLCVCLLCMDTCECYSAYVRRCVSIRSHAGLMTFRYLNWRQLRFQATIKSRPQRAVIWQKTNAPATVWALTYAPTCQTGLAGFDSLDCVTALPVHYVLACLVLLSCSECWLLFQCLPGRRFAQIKSKLFSIIHL